MKKNIWIFNHYATSMFFDHAGRHYSISEYLLKAGYKPTIFCASTYHNSLENNNTVFGKSRIDYVHKIPFVFVNTPNYKKNGIKRIINMISFYLKIFRVAKNYSVTTGKPDLILASSVHPLTLVAGIQIAQRLGIPCICEVRDLWPESIVEYGTLKKNCLVTKLLYLGEKWIYKKADNLIFTMQGGKNYIIDKKWDYANGGPIDLSKVFYLNNGVNLREFDENCSKYQIIDNDLDSDKFKVIFVGSIRKVNDIGFFVEVANYLKSIKENDILFLIFGDGPEKSKLSRECDKNGLENIIFKGRVLKQNVPYILSKSNLNLLHFQQNKLKKYGASLNKLFEYFASGKPIISDCEFGYDIIKKFNCGIVVDNGSPQQIAEAILKIKQSSREEICEFSRNSIKASKEYDYENLTKNLIELIEGI